MPDQKEDNLSESSVTPIVTKNIFFNVPSKSRMQGPLIEPKAESNSLDEEVKDAVQPGFWVKNKVLIIVIVVSVLVFGVAGYFVYSYFIESVDDTATQNQQALPTHTTNKPNSVQASDNTPKSALTSEWLTRYFEVSACKDESLCGDNSDPDRDGLVNLNEFKLGTDPNNADSDKDNLADGDEVNIFDTSPLQKSTTGSAKYTDTDDAKNGYDSKTPGKKFTEARLAEVKGKMKQFGLHQPTIVTLGDSLINLYGMTPDRGSTPSGNIPAANPAAIPGLDITPEAMLDRDTQRSVTIKKLGVALVKYKNDTGAYPLTESFIEMTSKIKPYNLIATNAQDPINKEPYIYIYQPSVEGKSFTLVYYSETQKTVIKYTSAQAEKDFVSEDAGLRDQQRMQDVESIRTALITYSSTKIAGNQSYVFPPVSKYKTELVPKFLSTIPKDPKSETDYDYQVSQNFDSFTLKAILEAPTAGTSGYLCNQEECRAY